MATAAGPLNLMACVRESSPQELQPDGDTPRHETSKKRRFHPFRGLRRMFRRKVRHEEELPPEELPGVEPGPPLDSHRSRSTSELLAADDPAARRRSGNGLYPCHSGLSVSHDSVFTAEQRSPHSSSEDLDTAQSSSSLSIQQFVPGVRRELFDAVRRRRGRGDTSEEDEDLGLPRSPCNSPTTADVLLEPGVKENASKSRSTCSDGSLLSMGSSEMDEDSSGHSSKASLHDKRPVYHDDLEVDITAAPLSHSAARHKMAVRPKRTHGAPRRRRIQQQIAGSPLPTTPEVNEELSARSASPEVKSRHDITAELSTCDASLSTSDSTTAPLPVSLPLETQLKSASLPPGLALSTAAEATVKLSRSHSNAAYRQTESSHHHYKRTISASELDSSVANALASEVLARARERFGAVGEEEEEEKGELITDDKSSKEKEDKKEESFFGRLLLRRSGKKKKEKSDEADAAQSSKPVITELPPAIPKRIDEKGRYANETVSEYNSSISQSQTFYHATKSSNLRSSAASRQRVEPINLPPSPEPERKDPLQDPAPITPPVPAPRFNIETDKQVASRMKVSYSVSPPKPTWPESRPLSSKTPEPIPIKHDIEKRLPEFVTKLQEQGSNGVEQKPKSKITGLSAYQQRLTQIGNDVDVEEREFSSLITTAEETFLPKVSVKKSRSFKGDVDFMSQSRSKLTNKIHESEVEEEQVAGVNDDGEDRLSVLSTVTAASHIPNGDEDEIEISPVMQTSELHTRQFTKNVFITSTTTSSEIVENGVESDECNIKQTEPSMKKSSSLDSISSAGEMVKPPSPLLGNISKKSSSIDSISSLTHQVTGPVGPSGISITQTVRLQEESRTTTMMKVESVTIVPTEPSALTRIQPDTPANPILTPRPHLVKREIRPIVTPEPQIPEFLRVQLNRVDSKPAVNVVLSTSAAFDGDTPRMQSRLRTVQERSNDKASSETMENTDSIKKETTGVVEVATPTVALRVKKDSFSNDSGPAVERTKKDSLSNEPAPTVARVKKDSFSNEPAPTVARLKKDSLSNEPAPMVARVKKDSISSDPAPVITRVKEDITPSESAPIPGKVIKDNSSSDPVPAAGKARKDSTSSDPVPTAGKGKRESSSSEPVPTAALRVRRKFSREEVNEIKVSSKTSEQIDSEKPESPSAVTVKSISVVTASSPSSRKSPVISVAGAVPLSPSAIKTSLKKQDSTENRNPMKKQKSFDFENITSVEKDQPVSETLQETSYQEVILRKKSLPWEIMLKKDEDSVVLVEKPSSVTESVCSQESIECASQKKTKSREFGSKKEEEVLTSTTFEKHTSTVEANTSQDSIASEVVMRKKSVSREQRKEEEPELLKVFARRSLKLKDSESEALSQQLTSEQQVGKSRDSDKENEGGDSPREERKKQLSKEPLIESKIPMDTTIKSSSIGITLNNPRSSTPGAVKYQRCFSSGSTVNNENTTSQGNETVLAVYQKDNTGSPEKRQRSRTVPESPRNDSNHIEKTPHRVWASLYKENNIELSGTTQGDTQIQTPDKDEANIPKFKRIQQRKEEWELRAQQAAKKTLP